MGRIYTDVFLVFSIYRSCIIRMVLGMAGGLCLPLLPAWHRLMRNGISHNYGPSCISKTDPSGHC